MKKDHIDLLFEELDKHISAVERTLNLISVARRPEYKHEHHHHAEDETYRPRIIGPTEEDPHQ